MSSTLKTYRVYCYDHVQHVVSSDLIKACSDDEVVEKATAAGFGTRCEIWEGNRLVAQLGSERLQA